MVVNIVEEFVGPCFLLICFVLILYGVFCAQVYFYYDTYREDHIIVRCVVLLLTLLETAHVALCMHAVYTYLIIDVVDPFALLEITWSIGTSIVLEFVISGLVHAYYIYRIWRLRSNIIVTCFLCSALIARLVVVARSDAYLYQYSAWTSVIADNHYWITVNVSFALNIVVDLSITTVLAVYLYKDRSLARKRSTRNMMTKILHFAFTAGALNLIASVALFIEANRAKHTLNFGGILELQAKLYANAMLAMLNARRRIREASADNYTVELSRLPSVSQSNPSQPVELGQKHKPLATETVRLYHDNRAHAVHLSQAMPAVHVVKEEV
ncbi:hypothetical protein BDW22DRAFT_1357833 [Trametopsis cervina]|nr:hypothetical protein BDW22DRAFT_1357833 [Trametopsis cervina]